MFGVMKTRWGGEWKKGDKDRERHSQRHLFHIRRCNHLWISLSYWVSKGFIVSLFFSLICMGVLYVYMFAYHSTTCARGGQRRMVDCLELELVCREFPCGCWDSNLSLWAGEPALLATEPSPQMLSFWSFYMRCKIAAIWLEWLMPARSRYGRHWGPASWWQMKYSFPEICGEFLKGIWVMGER